MRGWTTFEALGDDQSRTTITVKLPGMDVASGDKEFLTSRMEHSARNMKQLIESEASE